MHKHVAAWLLFFAALWWLWLLLAGEWNRTQFVAAACAAAVGATIGEIVRTRARVSAVPTAASLAAIPSAVGMVFVDFFVVIGAVVRRRNGTFRTADARDPWRAYLATLSPNAYVVDDETTHHLVPLQKSQEPT